MSAAKCETGWGDLSTRVLLDVERPSPHPAARKRASTLPLQGRVNKSRLLQRGRKILDQIIGMLEPGREADEALADAEFGARLRRQPLMRRGRRMGDEALGVAEIV